MGTRPAPGPPDAAAAERAVWIYCCGEGVRQGRTAAALCRPLPRGVAPDAPPLPRAPPVPRAPGPRRGGSYAPGGAGPPRPVPTQPRGCARLCLPPLSAPRPGGGAKASGEPAAIGERSWLKRSARRELGLPRPGAGPRRGVAEPCGPSYVPSQRAVPAPRSLPPSQSRATSRRLCTSRHRPAPPTAALRSLRRSALYPGSPPRLPDR